MTIEVTTNVDEHTIVELFTNSRRHAGEKHGLCNILDGKYHAGIVCPKNARNCRECPWCNESEERHIATVTELARQHGWAVTVNRNTEANDRLNVNGLQIIADKGRETVGLTLGQQNGTGYWAYKLQVDVK